MSDTKANKWTRNNGGELTMRRGRRAVIIDQNFSGSWYLHCYDDSIRVAWVRQVGHEPTFEFEARELGEDWLRDPTALLWMDRVELPGREDVWCWQGRAGFKVAA